MKLVCSQYSFGLSEIYSQELFREIFTSLNRDSRYYHNYQHVESILNQIDEVYLTQEQRVTMLLSAFYHDVFYTIGCKNNEIKSAKKLLTHFRFFEAINIISKANEIIRATTFHESNDELTCLFIDMDMSILGSEPKAYKDYLNAIKKEYSIIPQRMFKRGRRQFILSTLDRDAVFLTSDYQGKYEDKARYNLQQELLEL